MYCDACGTPLQTNQAFCGKCGKEVRPGVAVAYPRPDRVREHVRMVGILWLAYSAFHFMAGIVLSILARTIFSREFGASHGPAFLHVFFSMLGLFLLAKSVAGFVGGWGLLQREAWARGLVLMVAFIALLDFPIGTGIGVYTLWVLMPAEAEQQYHQQISEWRAA
jgi:hypothetical protein